MTSRPARRSRRGGEMQTLNQPSIDFLILADRAEVQGGKLYVMGGGWDRIGLQRFDTPAPISFAVGILIPWNACNEQHRLTVTIETPDNQPIDFRNEIGFMAGRPPWAQQGDVQRTILAAPVVPVLFPRPDTYSLVAAINGVVAKKVQFRVQNVTVAMMQPPPPALPPM